MPKFANDLANFFDCAAVIRGQTVKACVYPPSKADPLSDAATDTDALVATVLLRRVGEMAWNDPANPPRIGDEIRVGEQRFSITKVDVFDLNYFTIETRLK